MPHVNVEVSDELLKAIRMTCVQGGVKQKDWVVGVLGKAVGSEAQANVPVKVPGSGAVRRSKARGEVLEAKPERVRSEDNGAEAGGVERGKRPGVCSVCGAGVKDYGNSWLCENGHKALK